SVLDLLAHLTQDLLEALVAGALFDHPERVGDRDAGTHERGHLAREVHDLLPWHPLGRELELVEAAPLLEPLDLEVAQQQLVAQPFLARRVGCLFYLDAVGTGGDVLEGRHPCSPRGRTRCAAPRQSSSCPASRAELPVRAASASLARQRACAAR